ncbi:hypothetical protein ELI49_24195 [Rhizobium ruizarguesonis]|uniref:hypothetical protein n=1 Tax=Rhizobium ruizarguesonis TaxID=2081791 RepID=UPI001030EAFE|nr:hypothetical protein [Rhizobium ruizarguesonis]TAU12640.1 hypothetical protein ELI49_24195 [Rhizobium ruizarguesonis]
MWRIGNIGSNGLMLISLLLTSSTAVVAQDIQIMRLPSQVYIDDKITLSADVQKFDVKPITDLDLTTLNSSTVSPKTNTDYDVRVREFMEKNATDLGLQNNAANLSLSAVRKGLSGTLVEYQQNINGIPVLDTQIGVALNADGNVGSVTKDIVQIPTSKAGQVPSEAKISEPDALEIVQKDLKPEGAIIEAPKVSQAYLSTDGGFRLVYVIRVAVERPFGYWEYRVDSQDGSLVDKFDRRVQEQKRGEESPPAIEPLPAVDLLKAQADKAAKKTAAITGNPASGTAQVFSPNPVTSLNNVALLDNENSDVFVPAYATINLDNITTSNGKFFLVGPLVRIEDFEPGLHSVWTAPSTTSDGKWNASRGDNAFNDAMTYYYIDESLKYLRSLGYIGDRDLFPGGIAADSDGVAGKDNSHYVPDSDVIAFGHGCVDDNEDSDVILHELGHAIHDHLNPAWRGGDSGAIGEGFGDYWAFSYRMKLVSSGKPDFGKVFPWDGIDSCWGGRRADRTTATYNPAKRYDAHETVGGFVADELWSTPLVQTLITAKASGLKVEDVDKVVLEGMFFSGTNFTMRSLALTTVNKAKELYPSGEIAAILQSEFQKVKILE